MARVAEDVLGLALFDDAAAVHEDDAVGYLAGEGHLVSDDDHRHPIRGQLAHHREDLTDEFGVQSRGRLVEEHELGLHGQRSGDGDPLLLTAGQVPRIGAAAVPEADSGEEGLCLLARGRLAFAPDLYRCLHDVLEGGHMREQVEPLEDHPDLSALCRHGFVGELVEDTLPVVVAHELPVDPDSPAVDALQEVDASQERRLAGAGGPEQTDHLTGRNVHVDPLEHRVAVERLRHVDGADQGRRGCVVLGHQISVTPTGRTSACSRGPW